MKNRQKLRTLCALLGFSFLLTAFTDIPTIEPFKVIVDEIVFVTEGANLVEDPTMTVLKNLATDYHRKDTTRTVKWFDNVVGAAINNRHEAYLIRIEKLGQNGKKNVEVLEFKMLLEPEKKHAVIYLPMVGNPKKKNLQGKPILIAPSKTKIRLKSKDGLTCEMTFRSDGFTIDKIKYGQTTNKFHIVSFSKDNI